jgi:hypothetical protein
MIWSFWPTSVSSIGLACKAMRCPVGDYIAVRGRPRMTEELQELGLNVGPGRVGRFPLIAVNSDCPLPPSRA